MARRWVAGSVERRWVAISISSFSTLTWHCVLLSDKSQVLAVNLSCHFLSNENPARNPSSLATATTRGCTKSYVTCSLCATPFQSYCIICHRIPTSSFFPRRNEEGVTSSQSGGKKQQQQGSVLGFDQITESAALHSETTKSICTHTTERNCVLSSGQRPVHHGQH